MTDDIVRHVAFDCATGEQTWRDATDEETAELLERNAAWDKERTDAQAQREHDLDLIRQKAADDVAYAALVRHLGLPT